MSDRFMAFVLPEPNSGCWLWTGATFKKEDGSEYGLFAVSSQRKSVGAHRVSYELHTGAIPDGLVIDHKCRVKLCVNPDHLRAVTQKINATENNDSVCAMNARKTHCKRGHEFTAENTKLIPGGRDCRECRRMRRRKYWTLKGA